MGGQTRHIQQPDRLLVRLMLSRLASGEATAGEVATWASGWAFDGYGSDRLVARTVLSLTGADLMVSPTEYLHQRIDYEAWLDEFDKACSAGHLMTDAQATSERLAGIRNRLEAASGDRWSASEQRETVLETPGQPDRILTLTADGPSQTGRHHGPAGPTDALFVAHCRSDLAYLAGVVEGSETVDPGRLQEIRRRVDAATGEPWRIWLKSDGGLVGCNVLTLPASEPDIDLYLWIDGKLAPDDDFEFVGHTRSDIPALLRWISR